MEQYQLASLWRDRQYNWQTRMGDFTTVWGAAFVLCIPPVLSAITLMSEIRSALCVSVKWSQILAGCLVISNHDARPFPSYLKTMELSMDQFPLVFNSLLNIRKWNSAVFDHLLTHCMYVLIVELCHCGHAHRAQMRSVSCLFFVVSL